MHTSTNVVTVTKSAAEKIKSKGSSAVLKISIYAGGCKEFSYKQAIEKEYDSSSKLSASFETGSPIILNTKIQDLIITYNSIPAVVIDGSAIVFMDEGVTVDFIEDLTGSEFVIKNNKAASSCGCGNSFYVSE